MIGASLQTTRGIGHVEYVMIFAVMRFNDKWIVSGDEDGAVMIWDNENNIENGFARLDGDGRE